MDNGRTILKLIRAEKTLLCCLVNPMAENWPCRNCLDKAIVGLKKFKPEISMEEK